MPESPRTVPANDVHLIQLVRTRLGREDLNDRINVSSCGLVVTLHGTVEDRNEKLRLESVVRGVSGVKGVISKLGVRQEAGQKVFPNAPGGVD